MDDLISVIVPVYNVEKYLNKCVDSILNQTYTNIEIILVDDGSKDKSGSICDEYEKTDKRVKTIHQSNAGVCSARNIALSESKGKWVAFIDSDDWVEKKYIEELYKCAIKTNSDIVACGYNRVTGSNKECINNSGETTELSPREFLIKVLNPQTGMGFCHMKLYKRKIIKDVLFNVNLSVGEDALFNEQIVSNMDKMCILQKALYNYRINQNSVVRRYDAEYAIKYLRAMEITKEYLLKKYSEDEEIIQNYYNFVAFHVLLVAVNYCYTKDNNSKNKTELFKQVCNYSEFKDGIKISNYNNLSLTRKITLFTIKHKIYFLTKSICYIRNIQNKGKRKG